MRVRAISYQLSAISLVAVHAGSAQTRDTSKLKDLVVAATRTSLPSHAVGSSADRLDRRELRRRQLESLREALQLVPGVALLSNGAPGGVTSLFLRGVSSAQTLFLVDGIRVNDADAHYGSFLAGADLAGASRLEIVRGPQSTLYGGAAIGGVVLLEADPGSGRPRGELEAQGGSFSSWAGRFNGQGRNGPLGVSVALSATGTDNQRRPNDWNQRTQLVRLDYQFSPAVRVGATLRGLQHEYTDPGDIRTVNSTPVERNDFDNNLGTLWVETVPLGSWRSRLLGGYERQVIAGAGSFDGSAFSYATSSTRKVLDWQNTVSISPSVVLVAGLEREWSFAKSGEDRLDQRLFGFYGEGILTVTPALTFTGGVRRDEYNTFDHATTYRLTGAWLLERLGTKLRASVGTGFMPPSLAARFGSVFQNPNPDIRPEHSTGWDAGIEQSVLSGRGSLSATWFHNSLKDLIVFETAPFPQLGRNVNLDRAHTKGVELGGRVELGPVDVRAAYTLLSARSTSEPDPSLTRLIRRPRHTASAELLGAVTSRLALGAGVLVVADREDTDFNSFPAERVNPGDYAVTRLHGTYEFGRYLLRLRVENLFNQHYEPVYGYPALGRSMSASVAVRF